MSSFFRKVLRQAQSQFIGSQAQSDAVDWNGVVASLLATGTATSGSHSWTLATSGLVTYSAFNAADYGAGSLAAWWAADSLTLANNDPVSLWADQSGLGSDASGAGSARPLFKTAVQNSLPGVLFVKASTHFMSANGVVGVSSGSDLPYTMVHVLNPVAVSTGQTHTYSAWGSTLAANPRVWNYSNNGQYNTLRRDDAGTQLTSATGSIQTTGAQILTFRFAGTVMDVWRNGTQITTASALNVGAMTFNQFTFGGSVSPGPTISNFYDGHMFETLLYAAALSVEDRQAIEAAMGTKWGITVA